MKLSDTGIAQAAHTLIITERLSKLICDKYKWESLDNEDISKIETLVEIIRYPIEYQSSELIANRYGYTTESWLKMFRDDIGLIDAREMHARFEQIVKALDKVD